MGGAVVSEAASRGMIPNLVGVAVLDIVEGMLSSSNLADVPTFVFPFLIIFTRNR